MANNRLYIGSHEAKEYLFLCKGFGSGWSFRDTEKALILFIESDATIKESDSDKTSLFFFTEQDDIYQTILGKNSNWTEIKKENLR